MNQLKSLITEAFSSLYSDRRIPYDKILTSGVELGFRDLEAMAELLKLHHQNMELITKSMPQYGKPLWYPAEIYITSMQVQDLRKIEMHGELLAQRYYDLLFDASLAPKLNQEQVQALGECKFGANYYYRAKNFLEDNVPINNKPFVLESFLLQGKPLTNSDFITRFWHDVAPQGAFNVVNDFFDYVFRGKAAGKYSSMGRIMAEIMF